MNKRLSEADKIRLNFGYFHKYQSLVISAIRDTKNKIDNYGFTSPLVTKCIRWYDSSLVKLRIEMEGVVGSKDSLYTEKMMGLETDYLALKCACVMKSSELKKSNFARKLEEALR